ncbi:hypothetical protein D9615_004796 [Tricholomella constricta]|uniref:INO80 complex subunit B-like conserved region domain-containing protein n=1 Tax=Tricholomella constricta TaxID=117010 RepID=A0A8H5HHI4_9AGAR|nr:hypothetical protein D9615_004796 [Tricholomella constricta]
MPMATRTRRARALRSDMQMDSDVDMEAEEPGRQEDHDNGEEEDEGSNVDIEAVAEVEGDEDENESEDGDEDEDEGGDADEEDQEDEIQTDVEEPVGPLTSIPKASGSRLKIRLKMPAQSSSRFETPMIESEDSMSDSQPSTTRPMTTRQAVLASVLDSSHVSLTGSRQKKAPLNESELALRREETARKRRNLTEKKLEDEKAETINRLLKKQSRPRNKRTTAQRDNMDDVAPPSSMAGTRSNSNSTYHPSGRKKATKQSVEDQDDGDDEDGMDLEDNEDEEQPKGEVQVPTMYRWVSTSRIPSSQQGETPAKIQMRITFSVPASVLPSNPAAGVLDAMLLDKKASPVSTRPTGCSVPGCDKPFRYRLVKDWTRGACGISCLKLLEAGVETMT